MIKIIEQNQEQLNCIKTHPVSNDLDNFSSHYTFSFTELNENDNEEFQ